MQKFYLMSHDPNRSSRFECDIDSTNGNGFHVGLLHNSIHGKPLEQTVALPDFRLSQRSKMLDYFTIPGFSSTFFCTSKSLFNVISKHETDELYCTDIVIRKLQNTYDCVAIHHEANKTECVLDLENSTWDLRDRRTKARKSESIKFDSLRAMYAAKREAHATHRGCELMLETITMDYSSNLPDMFHARYPTLGTYCSERLKLAIEAINPTNVAFTPASELVAAINTQSQGYPRSFT